MIMKILLYFSNCYKTIKHYPKPIQVIYFECFTLCISIEFLFALPTKIYPAKTKYYLILIFFFIHLNKNLATKRKFS